MNNVEQHATITTACLGNQTTGLRILAPHIPPLLPPREVQHHLLWPSQGQVEEIPEKQRVTKKDKKLPRRWTRSGEASSNPKEGGKPCVRRSAWWVDKEAREQCWTVWLCSKVRRRQLPWMMIAAENLRRWKCQRDSQSSGDWSRGFGSQKEGQYEAPWNSCYNTFGRALCSRCFAHGDAWLHAKGPESSKWLHVLLKTSLRSHSGRLLYRTAASSFSNSCISRT